LPVREETRGDGHKNAKGKEKKNRKKGSKKVESQREGGKNKGKKSQSVNKWGEEK